MEEGHEPDRPHRVGRTERAPSAGVLGCVSACVAGLNLDWRKKEKNQDERIEEYAGKLPVAKKTQRQLLWLGSHKYSKRIHTTLIH
jgi:hypothetical protein